MIHIGKPFICKENDRVKLVAKMVDEHQGIDENIYFETDATWGEYFVDEGSDAFLLNAIMPAVKYGEDIEVDGAVSEQLYYNLNRYIIPLLSATYPPHVQSDTQFESAKQDVYIKIHVKSYSQNRYEPKANATGCSLGVDSFSSILHHIDESCLEGYKLTHLTYFNVGAHGTKDLKGTEESFFRDLKTIQKFGEEIGLPVVWVNSNVHLLYNDFSFNTSHTIRNASTVLSLQKLFKRYFYASGISFADYDLTQKDLAYFEDPVLARLSTECTSLMSDDYDLSRTDKTRYIAKYPITYKNLYVCLKEQISNDKGDDVISSIKDKYLNCSRCEKCMRTLLTLDIIKATKKYESIFDLEYYEKAKKYYIGKVLAYKKTNSLYADIYRLMKREDYDIPMFSKIFSPFYKLFTVLAPGKLYSKFLRKYRQQ